MHITLIEDDVDLGQAVADHLLAQGHAVEWLKTAAHAREALARLGEHRDSDMALLDLGLPDGDGMDLLAEVRGHTTPFPVLVLSARDQIRDRIHGLASGADDYLVKPFDLDELSARVDAVARRYALAPAPLLALSGGAQVDFQAQMVRRDGLTLSLTAMEWALLRCLAVHPGQTWSKEALARRLYSQGESSDSNTLEVLISRLRKKLGSEAISTTRQLGYRLERQPG
ncbi:MAG: response regulator transcription factor [Cytophagales bacterium]|nr:response regulator transcription factor [Rhizobacter sp.]